MATRKTTTTGTSWSTAAAPPTQHAHSMTSWKRQPLSGTSRRERFARPSGRPTGHMNPGGLFSKRFTRKESTTTNIALHSWGWLGSCTHHIITPKVVCISPPPNLKAQSPPMRATAVRNKISNLQPSVPGRMRTTMIRPRPLDCRSVLKIRTKDRRTDCHVFNDTHLHSRRLQQQPLTPTLWQKP